MEIAPLHQIYKGLEAGAIKAKKENLTRSLAPSHIQMLNKDIDEEISSLLKLLSRPNIALVGRFQTGKTTLFNQLTGQNHKIGDGIHPESNFKDCQNPSQHLRLPVNILDSPGMGDKRIKRNELASFITNSCIPDFLLYLMPVKNYYDETLRNEDFEFIDELKKSYRATTNKELSICMVFTCWQRTTPLARSLLVKEVIQVFSNFFCFLIFF